MSGKTTQAALNFLRGKEHGGRWSNENAGRVDQQLISMQVPIADARSMRAEMTLDAEGFTLRRFPVADPDWTNPAWLEQEYQPACARLVGDLTGAALAVPYHTPVIRMADPELREQTKSSPPGSFVHLDTTRQSLAPSVVATIGETELGKYSRYAMFNVWRCITPPPQNTPLALCDQRTVRFDDLVEGATEAGGQLFPYWASVWSGFQRWYYYPNMAMDEAIVFSGLHSAGSSAGCLHAGFELPEPVPGAIARASIEARVLAFFK